MCFCGHSLGNTPWKTFTHRVFAAVTFPTFTQPSSHAWSITYSSFFLTYLRVCSGFFSKLLFYVLFFSFTMVITWSLGGESAFGDRPASSMSKVSAAVNSDLGNGSFWVEIRDAMHVDQCSSISTRVWPHQLTSDLKRCLLFQECLQWSCLKKFRRLPLS